jgi:putative transposase
LIAVLRRGDFRVIHISIQATHVHLICEADDRKALANGVRALSIAAAHRLNAAVGRDRGCARRKGRVFTDRYHATVIDSARQCRNELAYVLRGSIKTTIDVRSGSGDYRACLSYPLTALGRSAVGLVEIRSRGSRSIAAINSTA